MTKLTTKESMSLSALKIAILLCDDPLDNARKSVGGHMGVWRMIFESALPLSEYPQIASMDNVELSAWDVVYKQEYPELNSVDAILVSGSRFNAFDEDEWITKLVGVLKRALATGKPLLGVCFGHQIIARVLGSRIIRNTNGWEIAVGDIGLTEAGKSLLGRDRLRLNMMNRDIVDGCPEGFEVIGSTKKTGNHGFYAPGKALTVQGHPEFTTAIEEEIIGLRHKTGVMSDDLVAEAQTRLRLEHDGQIMAAAFLKFALQYSGKTKELPV